MGRPKGCTRRNPLTREYMFSRMKRTPNGCAEWQGKRNKSGYGKICNEKREYLAHRLWWILNMGSIPEGLSVCHKCDNPPCCALDHLFLGTQKENSLDAARKGLMHQRLKADQVQEIRLSKEPTGDLARRFGMSRPHVVSIRNGRAWRHLPWPNKGRRTCQK